MNVTWTKDGEVLTMNETFTTTQYLINGMTARYDSIVMISLPPLDVVGTYTCSIDNSVTTVPSEQTLSLQGQ